MSEKETKSYREDYYKSLESLERLEEQSSIAFSHAQAVSIIVLRTGILLNAGALAALATAVATSPDIRFHEQDFFYSSASFVAGVSAALTSCFAAYFNLIAHSDYYVVNRDLSLLKITTSHREEQITTDIIKEIDNLTEASSRMVKKINFWFWLSLILVVTSFVLFLLGLFFVKDIMVAFNVFNPNHSFTFIIINFYINSPFCHP